MDKESHSLPTSKNAVPVKINLDEFQIDEDTFKPMTKGLGFHQDLKRPAFKPMPKEVKSFDPAKSTMSSALGSLGNVNKSVVKSSHSPSGLEAFYGAKPIENHSLISEEKIEVKSEKAKAFKSASLISQLSAWIIDVLVIASFVALTGALLVLASGIEFSMYSRLISNRDLLLFSAAIFSIYYLLYFTVLDLSSSPGKTVMGVRLVRADGKEVSVKNTFVRAFVSLLSSIALFLPMILDFQGRLSETKVVK